MQSGQGTGRQETAVEAWDRYCRHEAIVADPPSNASSYRSTSARSSSLSLGSKVITKESTRMSSEPADERSSAKDGDAEQKRQLLSSILKVKMAKMMALMNQQLEAIETLEDSWVKERSGKKWDVEQLKQKCLEWCQQESNTVAESMNCFNDFDV